jgi:hypothetical protein
MSNWRKWNAHIPGRIRLVQRAIQTIHQEPLLSLLRDDTPSCSASPNFRLITFTKYESVDTEQEGINSMFNYIYVAY